MKYLLLVVLLVVSSCSFRPLSEQISERVLENISNTDISYNGAYCPNIKQRCGGSNYEEWIQENGKLACACNK